MVFGVGFEEAMKNHIRRLASLMGVRTATALSLLTTLALRSTTVLAAQGGPGAVASAFTSAVSGFGQLLLLIAMALLGAGLAFKFLPTGSHRTKDAGGQLIDNALILAGLAVLGVYLLYFAGLVATTAAGGGENMGEPGSPWEVPRLG
jgi:hypothetical protein